MKLELIIFAVTAFLIYNAYYDGKFTKSLVHWKKYIKMATIAFVAISLYLMLKKRPEQSKNLLYYANNMVKFMPIDRSSMEMFSPVFDLTRDTCPPGAAEERGGGFMEALNTELNPGFFFENAVPYPERKIMNSGKKGTKRSVSETKKKYVASCQDWKCGNCGDKLNAWFEVDHKVRLEYGGGNDVQNLVALCRECHGKKTAMENM